MTTPPPPHSGNPGNPDQQGDPGQQGPQGQPGGPGGYPQAPNQVPPNQGPAGQVPPAQGPYPGGPVPQGQYPPPQAPYGQTPFGQVPPGQYPGAPVPGAYVAPKTRSLKWLWISLGGLVVVALVSFVAFIGLVANSDSNSGTASSGEDVQDDEDVTVGDCVVVSKAASADEGFDSDGVDVTASPCSDTVFTFIVAEKAPTDAACLDGYGSITFQESTIGGEARQRAGTYVLCLMPNYTEGKCYIEPGTDGSLTEFAITDCAAPGATSPGQVVYRVDSKTPGEAEPQCADGAFGQVYPKPTPVGICFSEVESGLQPA